MKKLLSFVLIFAMFLTINPAVVSSETSGQAEDEIQIYSKCLTTGEELIQSFGGPQNALMSKGKNADPIYPSWMTEENTDEIFYNQVGVTPFSLIGLDDRSRVTDTDTFPFCAIVCIQTTWLNGGTSWGTGFMWTDNDVITAGHMVYDINHGGWADTIQVWPGRDGTSINSGPHTAWWLHAGGGWVNSSDNNFDYGVIELNTAPDVGAFGMSVETNSTLNSLNVTIAGYPHPVPSGQAHAMWQHSGNTSSPTTNRIFYQIDTTDGQSGSPIYKTGNYAVGIHTLGIGTLTTHNSGVRITQTLYNWFLTFR